MLKLMIGKAGTGKTAAVINEIKQAVDARQPGRTSYALPFPEQVSGQTFLSGACRSGLSKGYLPHAYTYRTYIR